MRFFKFSVTILCLVSFLFISEAFAADVAKIGIIDIQQILGKSDAGKAANDKLQAKVKEVTDDLKAKQDAIQDENTRYQREAAVMSADARAEKEREMKIKALDYQDLEKKYKADIQAYQQDLLNKFRTDILGVVGEIGKKEGFTLILEKGEGGVVYAQDTIDITDKVLNSYNEAFAKKK